MFSGATNVLVSGGTFSQEFHSHSTVPNERKALALLQEKIAPGAFHNSEQRYDPPKCHPRTRIAIIRKIMHWVRNAEKQALLLWLYGAAGAGKSALAQTISEMCEEAGLLAATYFFSRNIVGLSDKTPLVATLVYQLTMAIPEMRPWVVEALEYDPMVLSRSLEVQMQMLLVRPLNEATRNERSAHAVKSCPRLVVLDGLDECSDPKAQAYILKIISAAISQLTVPIFFLVASRPECHIREAFNDDMLSNLTTTIVLDESYEPDEDIRTFLEAKFRDIKRQHPSKLNLPQTWPTYADLGRLIEKSSGQFIFAATAVKFIESHRHWPPDRLDIVFGTNSSDNSPFTELDALYQMIFCSVADISRVNDVLGLLLFKPFKDGWIQTTRLVEKFLLCRPGELDMVLSDLHCLISIPSASDEFGELRFFHASLADFLLDRSRSGKFFINQSEAYTRFTRLCINHMNKPHLLDNKSLPHRTFRLCCIKASPTPELLDDLYNFNLGAHLMNTSPVRHVVGVPELLGWFQEQKMPTHDKNLLEHHLSAVDKWLSGRLSAWPRTVSSSNFLALATFPLSVDHRSRAFTIITQNLEQLEIDFLWSSICSLQLNGGLDPPRRAKAPDLLQEQKDSISFRDFFVRPSKDDNSLEIMPLSEPHELPVEFATLISQFLTDPTRSGIYFIGSKQLSRLAATLWNFLHEWLPFDELSGGEIPKMWWNPHSSILARPNWRLGEELEQKIFYETRLYQPGKIALEIVSLILERISDPSEAKGLVKLIQDHPLRIWKHGDPLFAEKMQVGQAVGAFFKRAGVPPPFRND